MKNVIIQVTPPWEPLDPVTPGNHFVICIDYEAITGGANYQPNRW